KRLWTDPAAFCDHRKYLMDQRRSHLRNGSRRFDEPGQQQANDRNRPDRIRTKAIQYAGLLIDVRFSEVDAQDRWRPPTPSGPTPEPIGGRLDDSAGSAENEIVRSAQRLEQMVRNRIQRNPFRHVVFGARSSFRMIRVVEVGRLDISSDLKTQFWRIRLRLEY